MLGMNNTLAIIISAAVTVSYTLFGGLYSVAYTDVIQLLCVVFGLVLCIPFVWTNEAIDYETLSNIDWVGKVETIGIGAYIDFYLLVILGGIPWQVHRSSSPTKYQSTTVLSWLFRFNRSISNAYYRAERRNRLRFCPMLRPSVASYLHFHRPFWALWLKLQVCISLNQSVEIPIPIFEA